MNVDHNANPTPGSRRDPSCPTFVTITTVRVRIPLRRRSGLDFRRFLYRGPLKASAQLDNGMMDSAETGSYCNQFFACSSDRKRFMRLSNQTPGCFSRQNLGERDIHVPDGRRRIDFQDILVPHPDKDGSPTIQAVSVDADLSARKEPAHGQHFDSSLTVPLLVPFNSHQVVGRYVRKRCPRLDVIRLFNKPAGYGGPGCFTLHLPGLFGWHPESCYKLGILRGSASLYKLFHDSSVSSLHQLGFLHIIFPPCVLNNVPSLCKSVAGTCIREASLHTFVIDR
jgi:hypothetical protein